MGIETRDPGQVRMVLECQAGRLGPDPDTRGKGFYVGHALICKRDPFSCLMEDGWRKPIKGGRTVTIVVREEEA